jgi:hypothetical protein
MIFVLLLRKLKIKKQQTGVKCAMVITAYDTDVIQINWCGNIN